SSLTELFSPAIIGERVEGMLKGYDFVTRETLAYFEERPPQAERDAGFVRGNVAEMPQIQPIAPDAKPRLPRGVRLVHNEAQGGLVLLAPERVFKPDPIAAEILKRCTGEASFEAH